MEQKENQVLLKKKVPNVELKMKKSKMQNYKIQNQK